MHVWGWGAEEPWKRILFTILSGLILGLVILRLSKHLLTNSNTITMSSSTKQDTCAVCDKPTSKHCAACKSVRYCSQTCQTRHWQSGHKIKCKPLSAKRNSSIALVPSHYQVDKVLFPYHQFVNLFNSDIEIFPPCGLLNCGNSCFANVVLQCLTHTRPLLAYLLDKGHRRYCRRNEWCFLCELEAHMERACRGQHPFSPINILSRLPTIGPNLGYGKQEDAHEFMRFAIDTMQSVCLNEHGGEEVIHPKSQETTLIQHIFGGQLQSQVICTQCNQVSNQYENMMDLTVEIQGNATSLEECLDQFTSKEWLHGENMYKCDGCNDYVGAWKRLTIHQAPNILTIALKRFQSGRFGKINKRITFPESLDLTPYMSEGSDCTDKYELYAVIVHVDMLNASFFGHYICYTKGFQGDWYRIDDCKVTRVELDEVLSQGAYMLMYNRVSARPTCLRTFKSSTKRKQGGDKLTSESKVEHSSPVPLTNSAKPIDSGYISAHTHLFAGNSQLLDNTDNLEEHLSGVNCESVDGGLENSQIVNPVPSLPVSYETRDNGDYSSKELTLGLHRAQRVNRSYPSFEQSSSEVPNSTGSSVLGVHATCESTYSTSGVDSRSLEESDGFNTINGFPASKGKLIEHSFANVPSEGGNAENCAGVKRDRNGAALVETTSPVLSRIGDEPFDVASLRSSDRIDSEMNHVSSSSLEYAELPDDMEIDHTELSESDACSNGAVDGVVVNVSATNICLNSPEKSCVRGNSPCISIRHPELSSES